MSMDYVKKEANKGKKYQYFINGGITIEKIVRFYTFIEESHYYDHLSYIVGLAADSYEDGSYILRSIRDQDPSKFNNWNVTDINLRGFIKKGNRYISDGISYPIDWDSIIVYSESDGVLDLVESCLDRV